MFKVFNQQRLLVSFTFSVCWYIFLLSWNGSLTSVSEHAPNFFQLVISRLWLQSNRTMNERSAINSEKISTNVTLPTNKKSEKKNRWKSGVRHSNDKLNSSSWWFIISHEKWKQKPFFQNDSLRTMKIHHSTSKYRTVWLTNWISSFIQKCQIDWSEQSFALLGIILLIGK